MPHKIGNYIRVSTEEQALRTEGSLDSQKHRLTSFIDLRNMQSPGWGQVVENYIDDGVSAKDMKRPAFQRMMRDIQKGKISLILVTDISRLSRSIRDFCVLLDELKNAKAQFLSLKENFDTTTAAGEMMIFNMINLAQFERRQISERVTMNFHSRALRGLRNGGAPVLGFDLDPTNKAILRVNEDEAKDIRFIFQTYLEEGSLWKTAIKLRETKMRQKGFEENGNGEGTYAWSAQVVGNLLRNYSYAGLREVNKGRREEDQENLKTFERYQVVKAVWPAIVDEATFFAAQKMLDENLKLERARLSKAERRVFLFSGFANCGECGRALVGSTGHGKDQTHRYYIHRPLEGKPVTCAVKRFRADMMEPLVTDHVLTVLLREGYLDGLQKRLEDLEGSARADAVAKQQKIERQISQADQDMRKLIKLQLDSEDMDLKGIYDDQLKETKGKKDRLSLELRELNDTLADEITASEIRAAVEISAKEIQKAWPKTPPSLRKRLLRTLVDRLIFNADCIDIFYLRGTTSAVTVPELSENCPSRNKILAFKKPENTSENQNKSHEGESSWPYKLAANDTTPLASSPSHSAKVKGWYVIKNGCGG